MTETTEMEEVSDRRERFLRVAQRRTREILHRLRLLGNCANKSAYDYKPEEIEKIFEAIEDGFNEARAKFEPKKKIDFSL